VVEVRNELVPPPPPHTLRVRTLASAISHGTELLVYRGEVAPDLPLDLPTLSGSYGFPIKYGYAAVGRVIDVGPDTGGFAPGDTVFALHPHQTIFNVPVALATRLPATIDPLWGVFTANLETALTIAHDTPLKLGETALVFGQGVVGLLVTQLLRHSGAGRVLAVEPLAERQELARRIGVDAVVEPTTDLVARVRALNDGRSADVAVEVSGAPAALQHAIEAVADEGTVVVASWYGTKPVTLTLGGHFHRGRVRLRASQVGQLSPELLPRWDRARRTATVMSLLPRLRLQELISRRVAFDDAPTAYQLLDTRPGIATQVVLTYE
jgi:2-desacetyl-2-hydroxyethyl bacteriochlorophyllide A dehydrogenase